MSDPAGRSSHPGRGLSIQRGSRRVERMSKIVIQSMTMRARKVRAKAALKVTLPLYGFKNGQPPAEGALSELFRYWKLLKHDFYEPERNSRLKHLIQIGALEIDPPLQPGQRTPKDIGSQRYRVLKRHRLLGNLDPAPPPPPEPPEPTPPPTSVSKTPRAKHAAFHIARLYPNGTTRGVSSEVISKKLAKDPELLAGLAEKGWKPPSRGTVDRILGRRE
jgi:hypothetical protein